MALVRMVDQNDLDGLVALADTVDGFMTTMPNSVEGMKARIDSAILSINAKGDLPNDEVYLFVLEEDEEIVGISAIYSAVGISRPFYSYRLTKTSNVSVDLGIRNDIEVLNLVNDYNGHSEMATLFLNPQKRGGGRGVLLSYSRLMFMAANRQRFPDRVMAEIRGWTDEKGNSPFWEAVGQKFFKMNMAEADKRSGEEFQFMADLMPKFPVYVDLLPESAKQVIAKPNKTAEGAVAMLQKQGFRYQSQVDIFDAGICVEAWLDDVVLVRKAKLLTVDLSETELKKGSQNTHQAIVSKPELHGFRAVNTPVYFESEWDNLQSVSINSNALNDLQLHEGESALVYLL